MPELIKSLQGRDLGHLHIIAEQWGMELVAPDVRQALKQLIPLILERSRTAAVVESLPSEARAALEDLLQNDGRMPWALFTRRYGTVREMGAARRDRERPDLAPVSPSEMLWYRALLGRAFFDTPSGPEEFAYIPDDLVAFLPNRQAASAAALGRAATPPEKAFIQPASDRILDHACTLLAALRLGLPEAQRQALAEGWAASPSAVPLSVQTLQVLLTAAGLLDPSGLPLPEPTRLFLEARRAEALATLARAWLHSPIFNDLRLIPTLRAEGEWNNDPVRARLSILDFLSATVHPGSAELAERPFWSLNAFVEAVRQNYPDFQRSAGDYDSWYVRSTATGEYLRGFENWNQVDGALLRYVITGPLHWLGILDLGWSADPADDPAARPTSFRFSAWAEALLHAHPPEGLPAETGAVQVRSDAHLVIQRLAPRAVRYQLARFCEWEKETPQEYSYRLTPASLGRARQQGLTTGHLLRLLQRHAKTVAPALVKAIERWERLGVEARLENLLVLRLSTPEVLQTVRASKAARFLGEPLGPTAIIVKAGAAEKVLLILAELGILGEVRAE